MSNNTLYVVLIKAISQYSLEQITEFSLVPHHSQDQILIFIYQIVCQHNVSYRYSTRLQLHAHGNAHGLFGESIDIAVIC